VFGEVPCQLLVEGYHRAAPGVVVNQVADLSGKSEKPGEKLRVVLSGSLF